jgi:ProP effector
MKTGKFMTETTADLSASPETTDAADSPKPKSWKTKPTYAERKAAFAHHEIVLRGLAEQFPGIAPRGQACRPLKIGVHLDLAEALPDMDADAITTFCKIYTAATRYRRSLTEGAARVGLDGQPVGIVTAQDAAHAAKLLARAEAKEIAAREPRSAPVQKAPEPAQKPVEAKNAEPAPKHQDKAEKPTVTPPEPVKSVAETVAKPKTVAKAPAKRTVEVVKKRTFTVPARKTA